MEFNIQSAVQSRVFILVDLFITRWEKLHLKFSEKMFLSRGRAFVGQFFKIAQSSLLETGPRVSAVKLMHTIQFYNNGQFYQVL